MQLCRSVTFFHGLRRGGRAAPAAEEAGYGFKKFGYCFDMGKTDNKKFRTGVCIKREDISKLGG